MPQRCPRKRRASIASRLRFLSFQAVLVVALAGCSVAEMEKLATDKNDLYAPPLPEKQRDTGLSEKVGVELLSYESEITGGHRSMSGYSGELARMAIGNEDEIKLVEPIAVGGIEGLLYIVDAATKTVYRYDLVVNQIEPIPDFATNLQGPPGKIYVAKDRSFYIVDSIGKQVLHISEQGKVITRYQDLANLSRPIDVLVDEDTGDVLVADGSFSRIVIFNNAGQAMSAIGQRGHGPGRFRAITGIARGADGLFVTDRLELPAQVITMTGEYRYSFGESQLIYPTAIAVDQDQRVYISDRADNTIRVYQNGQLLFKYGGGGGGPGRFRIITDLWVSGDLLYVADSLNQRVQVLRINPNAPVKITPAG